MKRTRRNLLFLIIFLVGLPSIYSLPPVKERLGWRVAELVARFKYTLSPPEEIIFVPKENNIWATPMASPQTSPPVLPAVTVTQNHSTEQPVPSLTSTATMEPIPKSIQLDGFRHEYQTWNNCGPATLGMLLSYWGWEGDQRPIATFTKPNSRDKNVMPEELVAYMEAKTEFEVVYRVGGEIELLKSLLAAEIPVIIEKGFEGVEFKGWMGHYVLVTGFNNASQQFTLQDSYYGPNQIMEYEDLKSY